MRKAFLQFSTILACTFVGTRSFAQNSCNLVINGDFEVAKTAPLGGKIANIGPFPNVNGTGRDELATWVSTTYASPDYYNSTAPVGTDTNPASANSWGSFIPFNNTSGAINGALGLMTRDNYVAANDLYAEYATELLSASLKTDRSYYASMQVYCASRVKGASRIGLDVTVNDPRNYSLIPIPNSSAKRIPTYTHSGHGIQSAGVVTAQSWTEITGVFPGINGAQYLNVGNFDLNTYQPNVNSAAPFEQSYVYIDAVKIFEIPIAGPSQVTCNNGAATIGEGCPIPGATYAWRAQGFNGIMATTISTTVYTSDVYELTVTLPNGSEYKTSTIVTGCPCDKEMYAIDREDGTVCDNNTLYYIPLFTPGAMDPRYAATNGLTYSIYGPGQVSGSQFGYSPISGRFCVFLVPNRSLVQPSYELTITAHYANGCEASYTDYLGWDNSACWPWYYRVTPNPASAELTITSQSSLESDATIQGKADDNSPTGTEAWLYNGQGILVRHGKSKTASLTLDVHDLPEGIYHLRSGTEKNGLSKSIEIRH